MRCKQGLFQASTSPTESAFQNVSAQLSKLSGQTAWQKTCHVNGAHNTIFEKKKTLSKFVQAIVQMTRTQRCMVGTSTDCFFEGMRLILRVFTRGDTWVVHLWGASLRLCSGYWSFVSCLQVRLNAAKLLCLHLEKQHKIGCIDLCSQICYGITKARLWDRDVKMRCSSCMYYVFCSWCMAERIGRLREVHMWSCLRWVPVRCKFW